MTVVVVVVVVAAAVAVVTALVLACSRVHHCALKVVGWAYPMLGSARYGVRLPSGCLLRSRPTFGPHSMVCVGC